MSITIRGLRTQIVTSDPCNEIKVCSPNEAAWPDDVMPKQGAPRSPTYLFEMVSRPSCHLYLHEKYYIQSRRRHWLLWRRCFAYWSFDYRVRSQWNLVAYCYRDKIDKRTAASRLLVEHWLANCLREGRYGLAFEDIEEQALFSISDILDVSKKVGERFAAEAPANDYTVFDF